MSTPATRPQPQASKIPKSVLIFGGHGKTALALTSLLTSQQPTKYTVRSIIRSSTQSSKIASLGADPIILDLASATVETLTNVITDFKADILIWAAGAGFNPSDREGSKRQAEEIDNLAAVRLYDAAAITAAQPGRFGRRVIVISALDVRDRTKAIPEWYNEADIAGSERLWRVLAPYMNAKLASDSDLVSRPDRDLEWTIIRPGRLVDSYEGGGEEGGVEVGRVHFGKAVSRRDVARIVVACIEEEGKGTTAIAFDVVGGKEDVQSVITGIGERPGESDCFRGYF